MPAIYVGTVQDADRLLDQIRASAKCVHDRIAAQTDAPLDKLKRMKFEPAASTRSRIAHSVIDLARRFIFANEVGVRSWRGTAIAPAWLEARGGAAGARCRGQGRAAVHQGNGGAVAGDEGVKVTV